MSHPTLSSIHRVASPLRVRTLAAAALWLLGACAGNHLYEARYGPGNVSASELRSELMSFTDSYTAAINEAWNRAIPRSDAGKVVTDGEANARRLAHIRRLSTVSSALTIAASPNPMAGIADLITMLSLERRGLAGMRGVFGEAVVAELEGVYLQHEQRLRAIGASVFTAEELADLDQCIDTWRKENPDQRYVTTVRLEDFARIRQRADAPVLGKSLFGMLGIDPLSGLDPASREMQASRLLIERMFFYVGRLPLLLRWQTELAVEDLVREPHVNQALASFVTLAAAVDRIATAAEDLPANLAAERQGAVQDFAGVLAAERKGLIDDLGRTGVGLQGTLNDLRSTIEATDRLAASVTTTLQQADHLVGRFVEPTAPPTAAPPAPAIAARADTEKGGLAEFRETAALTSDTAQGLTALAQQIERLLSSPSWNQPAGSMQSVVAEVEASTRRTIDQAYNRLLVLAIAAPIALLAVALIYLAVHRRGLRHRAAATASGER